MEYVHIQICERKREQIKKLRKKQKLLAKIRKALLRNSCSFSQENEKLSLKPIFRFLLVGRYCTRFIPDPRILLFILQNIVGYIFF